MTEEVLNATWSLVTAVGHEIPVSKKGYLELIRTLSNKVRNEQRESKATTRQLAVEEVKIRELEMKGRLMTDDSVVV